MAIPKKGDVVWLKNWGGVIGIVHKYEIKTETIYMEPAYAGSIRINGFRDTCLKQSFFPVKEDQIQILTANEVFKKMRVVSKLVIKSILNEIHSAVAKARPIEYK